MIVFFVVFLFILIKLIKVIWNIEFGTKQKAKEKLFKQKLLDLQKRVDLFFTKFDILFAPSVLVPPFDVDIRYNIKILIAREILMLILGII
jgi:hypothetical protein